jgi:hypothetical protein
MRAARCLAVVSLCFVLAGEVAAGEEGFMPLFNGKDLSGWVNVNGAPGTFFVTDDMIITTGKPTGFLRTDRHYENFILEFDWMHVPSTPTAVGNSGLFVWGDPLPAVGTPYTRGIEVQVLVNLEKPDAYTSQGDIFSIWGAKCKPDRPHPMGWERCLPSENRCKGANEWNHYRVEGNNGVIKLSVNGKEVSGVSQCSPRKGYLALEAEGSECRFKNIKIKELPSTNPRPDEVAELARGAQNLFTGLDLSGWKADDEQKSHWQARDGVLSYDGKGGSLWTTQSYGDFELQLDVRYASKLKTPVRPGELFILGRDLPLEVTSATIQPGGQWNRVKVRLRQDMLTIAVNATTLVDNARIPRVGKGGPIALRQQNEPVQFRSIFIRPLGKE